MFTEMSVFGEKTDKWRETVTVLEVTDRRVTEKECGRQTEIKKQTKTDK